MRIRWRSFELPSRVVSDSETATGNYAKFRIEPFEKGFGNTIGNGLRRVLLSSIEGYAVTRVKIEGVQHEFTSIDGVLEDIVQIILNCKGILVRLGGDSAGPVTLRMDVTREGVVTAGDLQCPADAEVLNPDHKICTLTEDKTFQLEVEVERGRGYRTAEENELEDQPLGVIPIDSNFSPVTRVRYKVEATRVGKITNFDKLLLELWTDGTVTPENALIEAAKIYRKHLNPFVHYLQPGSTALASDSVEAEPEIAVQEAPSEDSIESQPISVLNLSVRARNCLDSENIRTIGQLVKLSVNDLLELRNFGQTSLKEVKLKLAEHGLQPAGTP